MSVRQERADGAIVPQARRNRTVALLLCWLASACASGAGFQRASIDERPPTAVPEWVGEPMTWSKLDAIEHWLLDSPQADPSWRLTAELTLAEGRLGISAEDDPRATGLPPARYAAARAGFERVVDHPGASADQRRRALIGLARLDDLGEAPPPDPGELISRARWGASAPISSRLDPVGGAWTRITVHHSAEVPGTLLDGSITDSTLALRKIQRTHVTHRSFGDIGYHFLVDAAGRVYEGRSLRWQGAHAGGALNRQNIGVCLLGDFQHRPPSAQALASLSRLLDDLRAEHTIPTESVRGHSDLKQTLCPGGALAIWITAYRAGRAASAWPRHANVRARPAAAPVGGGVVH